MQPGEGPLQFMMEIDRVVADLHRLGDRSVTQLRKCVIVGAGLSADYQIEVRILENNPTGLERVEIERVVENQYNRILRQQQDSKALLASKGTTTVDRGEKKRGSRNRFEGNCFNCGRKVTALKKWEREEEDRKNRRCRRRQKGGGRGKCYVCGREEHFAHKHCGLCRSLEHRTRDCEERGAEKGAMLAKINVPENSEVGLMAATV